MSSCGKALLTYVSGMLCMGCLPDWRWEKYVLSKDPSKSLPIEEFDPELLLNFTIDLNSDPLQLSVLIGRQACEDLYSVCKPLMQSFEQFSNDSAMAIGGFADQITSNQWNFNAFSTSEKLTIRNNAQQLARNLSHRNVSWLKPQGSETGVDTKTVPTYNPSAEQQALANFKASLRNLGTEYPYDPVAYYNFDPSINFEDPVIMNSQMCQLMTQAKTCVLCSGSERNSSCDQLDAVYYEIETDTDRQYRDFSAYFFQVRAVYLVYNDGGNEFVRKLLFPPFREGEIVLKLKDSTWEFKKNYFQVFL